MNNDNNIETEKMILETRNYIMNLSINKNNEYFLFEPIYNEINNDIIKTKVDNLIKLLNSDKRSSILSMDFEKEIWYLI